MKRLLLRAVALVALPLASVAGAETRTLNPAQGGSINEDVSPAVLAGRPTTVRQWVELDPTVVPHAVNSNKIFLNNCKPNGCVVRSGSPSSQNTSGSQGSWGINGTRTLTPFPSNVSWDAVVACLQDVFTPFGAELVTTDPGNVPHFEIMIAGHPNDLGFGSGTGGIAPFNCNVDYIPNALVFDFAKIWGGDIEEICSTAAQEIAHAWTLDHVTDASDPLTYFPYSGRRRFKNAPVQCGSDCVNGQGPFGQTCSGQNHSCTCTGSQTQNSFQTITALFGNGVPTPPIVDITQPKTGDLVAPGFPVVADVSDDNGVAMVQLYVNSMLVSTATQIPYVFNAPATLMDGTHTVRVVGTDLFGSTTSKQVQVVIGKPCGKPADCPLDTDTCIGGRCVPGPGAQGGLGTACTDGTMCASGQCAADSSGSAYCVEICKLGEGECPSGFGCLKAGEGGVCWPGYDDGTGGCSSGSDGPLTIGLGLIAFLIARRRPRR